MCQSLSHYLVDLLLICLVKISISSLQNYRHLIIKEFLYLFFALNWQKSLSIYEKLPWNWKILFYRSFYDEELIKTCLFIRFMSTCFHHKLKLLYSGCHQICRQGMNFVSKREIDKRKSNFFYQSDYLIFKL